jgi:excinuclease ABC subunit C
LTKAPINSKLQTLPEASGVYKYFDKYGTIIYIGKAINLRKRVQSYFVGLQSKDAKTRILVSKIWDVEITVVPTEMDALLLENSLIKEFQPKYNINLKDDKSYPLIQITKERFPKIRSIRNPKKDGSLYFGPYTSPKLMYMLLDLFKKIYPTRNCNLNLSEKNIKAGKFKVCLEYQIGNCKGPCEAYQSEENYNESIQNIKHILRGNLSVVKKHLSEQMKDASDQWNFELAQQYKNKIDLLQKYQSKSTVVNVNISDVDVLNISTNERFAYINFLRIQSGIIIQSKNIEIKKKLEETKEELLEKAYAHFYQADLNTTEVIVPIELSISEKFTVPKSGEKKKLLDISLRNAALFMREKTNQYEKLNPDIKVDRLLDGIKKDLNLKELPYHIECFDNSNIQGHFPVAACVVFKNGKPAKKDYRHFNIQTVVGPDDFASMYEALTRRYSRLLKEEKPLPQLIVIDGGKGQLSSAIAALKDLNLYGEIAIVGIAKRLEEIYYPNDPLPLHLSKTSDTLKTLQHLRDEAHRFGITHHRNRRSKGTIGSELTKIPNIGPKTAKNLLRKFKSIKLLKNAKIEDIAEVVGKVKAKQIKTYFEQK